MSSSDRFTDFECRNRRSRQQCRDQQFFQFERARHDIEDIGQSRHVDGDQGQTDRDHYCAEKPPVEVLYQILVEDRFGLGTHVYGGHDLAQVDGQESHRNCVDT